MQQSDPIIDTHSTMTRAEYERMHGRTVPADHVRVFFDAMAGGRHVRFSCEVAPDLESRAVRWCERQRAANGASGAEIRVEQVYSVGSNGGWDDGPRADSQA